MKHSIDSLKELGRYDDAVAMAQNLLRGDPHNASLLYKIASLYDVQGLELQAIPFYRAAIEHNLAGQELQEAYLGLGSTYRALGLYQESLDTFDRALVSFPQAKEITLFRAMTLYNLGETKEAVATLLILLAETSNHQDISLYQKAIRQYAADLDRIG
ncbi:MULTISPECIES: tetratricopeptide repeat protein [Yersinia]|uniref:Tetratricopeptide repeat family protein n=1 Tax=Yersinia rochesterensis TaxID=1604335 RepID=A0A386HBT7_9GAMM|nr:MULTISPECIES: tetratricopeptide repeat protein [Yersinia]AJI86145.1 tetratricopeptide repeat family protein [Yersinia frederiksenii Y225]CNH01588.1 Predicted O-linked N-acetylglucosamine transferase%2C SPINDLY family [Yersinia kristensenii]AIN16723.1 tetratricopeptide repeat family protein [Yersinia rochesterensis]AJJ37442.1 tetratricopeptide repeat family protein [Yersinia rochesterensis]AYD43278.1 tetratricopeptide repeat protein [Yersinia rochesterensis]